MGRLTKTEQQIIDLLEQLPVRHWDYRKPTEFANRLRVLEGNKRQEYWDNRKASATAKRESAAAKKAKLDPLIVVWVKEHVVPDMVVRMKGTRDHGIRKVISIDDDKIVARQVKLQGTWGANLNERGPVLLDHCITTHMLNKVSSIVNPATLDLREEGPVSWEETPITSLIETD